MKKELNKSKLVSIITKSIDWHTMMLPRIQKDGFKWTKSELTKHIANSVADDILTLLKSAMNQTNKPPEWWKEKFYERFPIDKIAEGNTKWGDYKLSQLHLAILDFISQTLLTERATLRGKVENLNPGIGYNGVSEESLVFKDDVLKLLE